MDLTSDGAASSAVDAALSSTDMLHRSSHLTPPPRCIVTSEQVSNVSVYEWVQQSLAHVCWEWFTWHTRRIGRVVCQAHTQTHSNDLCEQGHGSAYTSIAFASRYKQVHELCKVLTDDPHLHSHRSCDDQQPTTPHTAHTDASICLPTATTLSHLRRTRAPGTARNTYGGLYRRRTDTTLNVHHKDSRAPQHDTVRVCVCVCVCVWRSLCCAYASTDVRDGGI